MLKAIYPCASSIPLDLVVLSGVETFLFDDFDISLIPITAAKDEDASELLNSKVSVDTSSRLQPADVSKS